MLRCLVVDDDELGRELIALHLDGVAQCEMAENGQKAVDMFRKAIEDATPFDFIILDIVMPGMDGHATAKAIRQIEKERGVAVNEGIVIIVISSLNTPKDVVQAYLSASSAAHIVKPVQPGKLLKILDKLGMLDSKI